MNPLPLWTPSPSVRESANLTRLTRWLRENRGLHFESYQDLWNWSVERNSTEFWSALLDYFDIRYDGRYTEVVSTVGMPRCRWFEGIRLNYAEHVFRNYSDSQPAILFQSERSPLCEISWKVLKEQTAALQYYLLQVGVQEGDCVAAFLPCIPEATIGFLAVNAIGAIWSSCSPDFGTKAVIDRFAQTEPKVLIVSQSYGYAGKKFDKSEVIREMVTALPSLKRIILLEGDLDGMPARSSRFITWADALSATHWELTFRRVPFSHPIWVLYSSGTTGLPKAITHSHGGILLEHLKYLTFHQDVKPGERCFWYTTTGWMMWNYINSSLLCGATLVLYDGSPAFPDLNTLWQFVAKAGVHHFGTSAGFILSNRKTGLHPGQSFDLSVLRSVGSTGSTLPPEGFDWIYREVKADVWLTSMSGGTDVCTAFVGGNPTLPVYAGEIQCRTLGCRLDALDEHGHPVQDELGEMVITQPMPSMPIYFWNDPDYSHYTESYFELFPGLWRQGDWIRITPRNGIIIYGRSDATLNRGGVQIGTSEIYRAVDKVREVKDSLVVCLEQDHGAFYMPLFVQLHEGFSLTEDLQQKINQQIREDYSPRHVPDRIIVVPDIPYTLSGKKTETPVKKVLMGKPPGHSLNTGSLRNPAALDFFIDYYKTLSA